MDGDLKIGAVFSLAPDTKSTMSPDEAPDASEDLPCGVDDNTGAAGDTQSATGDTQRTENEILVSAGETPIADGQVYTEMTADDCEVSANIAEMTRNEADDVITGTDPEMNSSAEVNELEIDVESGDVTTESAFSPDVSTENPPVLPMEENVGILLSVYPDEIEEALPPPILSPVINETVKVKQEPVEYDG